MSKKKFDERDRDRVIKEIQKIAGIHLSPIGNYRKFFRGNDQKHYCVVGGYGDWHGLNKDFLAPLSAGEKDRILIIARMMRLRIELYAGSMNELIKNKNLLVWTKNTGSSEYQFDVEYRYIDKASIKQLPGYHLRKIHEFEYDPEKEDLVSAFRSMSEEQQEEVLAKLIAKSKSKEEPKL